MTGVEVTLKDECSGVTWSEETDSGTGPVHVGTEDTTFEDRTEGDDLCDSDVC